jgi:DNA mismatch repair ATPase MutL
MTVRRLIKRSVACRIASSPHNLPSRITRWADDEIAAFDKDTLPSGVHKNSSSNSSDTTIHEEQQQQQQEHNASTNNSQAGGSSSSTLRVLQLQDEGTSVTPIRGCLKKPHDYCCRTEKCKRVAFVYNDALATCIETGETLSLTAKSTERSTLLSSSSKDSSFDSNHQQEQEQEQEQKCAEEHEQEQEQEQDLSPDEQEYAHVLHQLSQQQATTPAQQALFDAQDQAVEESTELAEKVKTALEMHATANGWLDFALYVTRDAETLTALARMAEKYKHVTKIASFRGDERLHAVCGRPNLALPNELYDDCRTSMSGFKTPGGGHCS